MSAKPSQLTQERPALRVIVSGDAEPHPRVVAEVLSDGSIRVVGARERQDDRSFSVGHLAGEGWTIWWDRRYWD